ncbi:MAG TPA: LLM class flavin-dependent oxidoreductase [Nitrososphaerales archaeon]|nr:LLM class flavin-dependent oxidoreductase [Nitrososphaerales archaeon]
MHSSKRGDRIGLSYVIAQGPNSSGEMVDAALIAESSGFDTVLVPEHYYDREATTVVGAIARSTKRIRVGTGVINPYTRYPSLIAMTAATMDELSNGRAVLGLGSGGVIGSLEHGIPNEFVGQEFSHPLAHLKEIVQVLRILLSGQSVTFEGDFYKLRDVKLHFKPVQDRIPIYFGQQGPKMMELAGQIADGVLITLCCTIPYVRDVISRIEQSEEKAGRKNSSVDYAARIITSMSHDERKAIRDAKQLVGRVFIHPGAKPVMDITGFSLDTQAMKRAVELGRSEEIYDLVPDDIVQMTTASGTKAQIVERVEEFRKAGVTLPLIVPVGKENYPEVIQAFAK